MPPEDPAFSKSTSFEFSGTGASRWASVQHMRFPGVGPSRAAPSVSPILPLPLIMGCLRHFDTYEFIASGTHFTISVFQVPLEDPDFEIYEPSIFQVPTSRFSGTALKSKL